MHIIAVGLHANGWSTAPHMTLTFAMLGPRKCVTLHWPDCLLIHLLVHASDVSCTCATRP